MIAQIADQDKDLDQLIYHDKSLRRSAEYSDGADELIQFYPSDALCQGPRRSFLPVLL
jgi:hypothetical protein